MAILNKFTCAAGAVVIIAGGAATFFFRGSLPTLRRPSPPAAAATADSSKLEMPTGAILIPIGEGRCKMHALDNVSGQIDDYGVVNCSNASDQMAEAWRRAMNQDKFVEIGKSFRHEPDQPAPGKEK